MYCVKCNNDVVNCTCKDIDERLASLAESPHAGIAAQQNIAAREITTLRRQLEAAEGVIEAARAADKEYYPINTLYNRASVIMNEGVLKALRDAIQAYDEADK